MAVLDGQLAMDGTPLELELYANTLPGGFHWLVTSSSSRSPARMLKWGSGQWADHATGPAVGLQDSYTLLKRVTDLRSTLLSTSTPLPAALLLVRQYPANITMIGSRIQVILPGIILQEFASPSIKSPTGKWYSPSGQAVIIAPNELQNYQADVVTPAFASPDLWQSPNYVFPYWLGTDPAQESAENRNLFFAGLLFGVAAGAIIGSAQDVTARYRTWRDNISAGHTKAATQAYQPPNKQS